MKRKYYPRSYKRLFLQERDVDIICYCIEQKFLTVEQVSDRFFRQKEKSKYPHQSAYKRILILQKFDMLSLKPILTGEKIITATDIGASELDKRGMDRLNPVKSVDYRYYEHDRRVSDVRIAFENLDLVDSWISERYLKSEYTRATRVPDAAFGFKNGQKGALEVEIARKGKKRYEQIFMEYLEKRFGKVDLLFYVCNTLKQLESLAEMTKDYRWVYYALYEQVMKDGAQAVFANTGDHFTLGDLSP